MAKLVDHLFIKLLQSWSYVHHGIYFKELTEPSTKQKKRSTLPTRKMVADVSCLPKPCFLTKLCNYDETISQGPG